MARTRQIRAGRAFVELGVDNQLTRGLRRAQRQLRNFGQQVQQIGVRMAALGAAITAPLAASVRHFQTAGDELDKLSQRTGFSVETLSELRFAAQLAGTDMRGLESSLRRMQRTIFDAERGLSTAKDALRVMGIELDDLRGRSPDQQFKRIADGLAGLEDATIQAAVAQQIFGSRGTALLPLLSRGAAGIEEFQQAARELGLTVSTEAAEAAAEFNDQMTALRSVVRQAVFEIGGSLAPVVGRAVEAITNVGVAIGDWIRRNRDLVVWVGILGASLLAGGAALITLGIAIKVAAAAIGGLLAVIAGAVKVVALLKVGIAALMSPIVLVSAAVVGLGAFIVHASGKAGDALRWLGERFSDLAGFAKRSFRGIGDAIVAGDLALAMEILWLSIRRVWQEGISRLTRMWTNFRATLNEIAVKAFFGMADIAVRAFAAIQRAWVRVRDFFRETFADIGTGFASAMEGRRVDAEVEALRARRDAGEITQDEFREEFRELMREGLERQGQINRDHNSRLREINEENEKDLERISRQQAERQEAIGEMLVDSMRTLEDGRDAALKETDEKLVEAQREWREAIESAREARESLPDVDGPDRLRSPAEFMGDFDEIMARLQGTVERSIDVRGTFSPLALQGLQGGVAGVQERIASSSEQTARNTRDIKRNTDEGGLTFSA